MEERLIKVGSFQKAGFLSSVCSEFGLSANDDGFITWKFKLSSMMKAGGY